MPSLVIPNAVLATRVSSHAALIEDNADSLFFAPNDVTASREVICGNYEIKYRGNANRVRDLKGGAGVRKISDEAIDTRAVERDRSSLILEANDQMLRIGGAENGPKPVRLGISTLFVKEFFLHQHTKTLTDVVILADNSAGIAKGLLDGYIDIGCIYANSESEDIDEMVVNEINEPFAWVRSKDFVLRPGAPIPILTWPGDDLMISTLTRLGLMYKIVFSSPDYHAKLAALEAGIGVAALPIRLIPPSLMRAKEYYLPELPPVKALLCARPGIDAMRSEKLLELLSSLFFRSLQATG